MPDNNKPYVIIVGVDFSESGDIALEAAFQLADDRYPADVHVVNVLPAYLPGGTPNDDVYTAGVAPSIGEANTRLRNYVEEKLVAHQDKGARRAPARVVTHIRTDSAAHEVAQLAADLEADMVVVGTHGRRGISRLLLGSTAEATVRLAPCPVLVARPKTAPVSEPVIEPPCPRCVETRIATNGAEFWCEQHRERHGQRHTYHQRDRVGQDSTLPLVMHGRGTA
jgi:nucleotide-binding universal stress UspA family protein